VSEKMVFSKSARSLDLSPGWNANMERCPATGGGVAAHLADDPNVARAFYLIARLISPHPRSHLATRDVGEKTLVFQSLKPWLQSPLQLKDESDADYCIVNK
jgi:hypothetical protein